MGAWCLVAQIEARPSCALRAASAAKLKIAQKKRASSGAAARASRGKDSLKESQASDEHPRPPGCFDGEAAEACCYFGEKIGGDDVIEASEFHDGEKILKSESPACMSLMMAKS